MEKQNEKKELNEKQKRFCESYVEDWNATRAYQVAYPDASYESANASGARLLVNVSVKAYIEEIQKDIAKLAGLSKLGVLNKLKEIIEDYPTEDMEDSQEMPKAKPVETRDRLKALEVVNKMLGFNDPEKIESSVTNQGVNTVIFTSTGVLPIENESDINED